MLILTRRTGESLMIGDSVVITVFEVKGNQVRIGIDAPKHVTIYREEIYKQIQEENKAAASSSVSDLPLEGAGAFFGDTSGERKKPLQSLTAFKFGAGTKGGEKTSHGNTQGSEAAKKEPAGSKDDGLEVVRKNPTKREGK